jgi:hypothetical protein
MLSVLAWLAQKFSVVVEKWPEVLMQKFSSKYSRILFL